MRILLCMLICACSMASEAEIRAKREEIALCRKIISEATVRLASRSLTTEQRNYAESQVKTANERIGRAVGDIARIEAAVARAKAGIVEEKKPETAEVAKASEPTKPAPYIVELMDGTKLECLRYMELENEYSLQLLDKKLKAVSKDLVKEIRKKTETAFTD